MLASANEEEMAAFGEATSMLFHLFLGGTVLLHVRVVSLGRVDCVCAVAVDEEMQPAEPPPSTKELFYTEGTQDLLNARTQVSLEPTWWGSQRSQRLSARTNIMYRSRHADRAILAATRGPAIGGGVAET